MDLQLTFANGNMTGDGNDDIGRFLIKGRYDDASRECYWTKTYVGAHDVFYRGFREGKGIWGTWEITIQSHGGFHIWPRHAGEGETATEEAALGELVDAIATTEDTAIRTPRIRRAELHEAHSCHFSSVRASCNSALQMASWRLGINYGCYHGTSGRLCLSQAGTDKLLALRRVWIWESARLSLMGA